MSTYLGILHSRERLWSCTDGFITTCLLLKQTTTLVTERMPVATDIENRYSSKRPSPVFDHGEMLLNSQLIIPRGGPGPAYVKGHEIHCELMPYKKNSLDWLHYFDNGFVKFDFLFMQFQERCIYKSVFCFVIVLLSETQSTGAHVDEDFHVGWVCFLWHAIIASEKVITRFCSLNILSLSVVTLSVAISASTGFFSFIKKITGCICSLTAASTLGLLVEKNVFQFLRVRLK